MSNSVFDDNTSANVADQAAPKTPSYEELLARLAHKDQFIEQLKGETAGLREELGQRVGAEDLFKKIVESKPEPAASVAAPKDEPKPVGEPVDLAQLVRAEIEARDSQQTATQNAQRVLSVLVDRYGSEEEAGKVVREKAAQLGVSTSFLQEVATKSPEAFFATVGINPNQTDTQAPALRPDVNSAALKTQTPDGGYGTKEYFDNMRQNNPAQYWSPSVQNAIFKAAQEGTYKL